MVQKYRDSRPSILLRTAAFFAFFATAVFAQDDPPTRVARLNYINGNVSMEPAGVDEWAPAIINRPFTLGDYLYTDQSSVAELHMDVAVMRMGQFTSFGFLNLSDQAVQLKLTEGDMYLRVHDLDPSESFEVDTPNAAITLLRNGVYRIHVDPNQNTTFVFARTGQVEVTGGGQAFTLNPGNSAALSGTDQLAFDIQGPPAPDAFDNWCEQRDAREAQMRSVQYLPPTLVGSEDLDDYGTWNEDPVYGAVWYPRAVPVGWAPYHSGHWAWIEPWGWTWVDDNPWGYAPFHYGRWVYWHDRWAWAPGPCARMAGYGGYHGPVIRPVYAPALVAFFGGAHWGVSISVGGGPSLGWVPLGWGEVYTPSYHCSPRYFNNVNVNNTRIVNTTNITNVYNTVYVNKTVYNQTYVNVRAPNAVSAMPQNAFASGRPVSRTGTFVSQAQLAHLQPAQAALVAPPVVPTRQAVAASLGRPAARPQAQVLQRQVMAKNTPPVQPASFAARQSFLQQHAGQPIDIPAMRRTAAQQPRPNPGVREIGKVQPVQVHEGQHTENAAHSQPVQGRQPQAVPRPAPPVAAQHGSPQHGVPPNVRQPQQPERTNAATHQEPHTNNQVSRGTSTQGNEHPAARPVPTEGERPRPEPNANKPQEHSNSHEAGQAPSHGTPPARAPEHTQAPSHEQHSAPEKQKSKPQEKDNKR